MNEVTEPVSEVNPSTEKYLAVYSRDPKGNPTGVVVAIKDKETGEVEFGWSSCNEKDKFTKVRAREIALARARKRTRKPISSSVSEVVTEQFLERCEYYFKTTSVNPPAMFAMINGKKVLFDCNG